MAKFESNKEFMLALAGLINRWCEQRALRQLALILPEYLAFNGMSDGWYELHASFGRLRGLGPDSYEPSDWRAVIDLLNTIDRMLFP
jgi:hypothetical protein